jgi:predicted metal-dependent peptidase
MSQLDIEESFAEIKGVTESTNNKLALIQVDADISNVSFIDKKTKSLNIFGGGGTCMFPAVDFLLNSKRQKERKKWKIKEVNVIIILTDGGTEYSWEKRYDFPIIWVSTTNELDFDTSTYKKHKVLFLNKERKSIWD